MTSLKQGTMQDELKICDCSNPGTVWSDKTWVCERCYKIDSARKYRFHADNRMMKAATMMPEYKVYQIKLNNL